MMPYCVMISNIVMFKSRAGNSKEYYNIIILLNTDTETERVNNF